MKEVEKLATLYGVTEEVAAHVVINSYSPENEKGKRVDLHQVNEDFKNEVSYSKASRKSNKKNMVVGEEGLAAKIKFFEVTNPKEVLRVLQNGTKPAKADLNILYILANDYNLPNPVINVVIDFILTMNNNVLTTYSAEKIAASLSREGVETAVDAMEYLKANYVRENKAKKTTTAKTTKVEIETNKAEQTSEEEDQEILEFFKDR